MGSDGSTTGSSKLQVKEMKIETGNKEVSCIRGGVQSDDKPYSSFKVANMADNLGNEVREQNRVNLGLPNAPKVMQLSKSTKHKIACIS